MKIKKGKLIVIEGTDGSGKATQIELLARSLIKKGYKVKTADFPQYDKPSSYFVSKYLRGEYGKVGPYKASLFFALDRYDKSFEIKKWLSGGHIVISNRYVSANMGHQAGKIADLKERSVYLKWLQNLEYEIFDIPKPDLTILLAMPPEIGQELVNQKAKREYLKGAKRDIHEKDLKHLKDAFRAYLEVAKKYKWVIVNCVSGEKLNTREAIHEEILKKVQRFAK